MLPVLVIPLKIAGLLKVAVPPIPTLPVKVEVPVTFKEERLDRPETFSPFSNV